MSRNILLIGMPAVGKSTYGKMLADKLAMRFVDTDDLVESIAGKACSKLVNEDGIEAFAKVESQALQSILDNAGDFENTVIATGGSAIYRAETQELSEACLVVHLHCRANTLEKRIGNAEQRGVVFPNGMSFTELFQERMPLYAKVADVEFSTDSKNGNLGQLSKKLLDRVKVDIQQYQTDLEWVQQALELAAVAESKDEVPVGAIVVVGGEKVGEGYNQPISTNDPTAHAEVVAIRQATAALDNYRLTKATLYITLEPCAMCAGAILHSRIKRVVYAASDLKAGAAGSVLNILQNDQLNHRCSVTKGIKKAEAVNALQSFFRSRRAKNK